MALARYINTLAISMDFGCPLDTIHTMAILLTQYIPWPYFRHNKRRILKSQIGHFETESTGRMEYMGCAKILKSDDSEEVVCQNMFVDDRPLKIADLLVCTGMMCIWS